MNIKEYLTPYKYGKPVLTGSGKEGAFDKNAVDCPFVFQHNGKFYMMYVGFDGIGYQTALATSDDLLNWEHLAVILRRDDNNHWDSENIAGTWILKENDIHSPPVLKKWNNKYWLVYHAYPNQGYEEGPAKIGLAWTEDEELLEWNKLKDPILVPEKKYEWESGGLYKECLIEHENTFYLFYNAKNSETRWKEQIGVATSKDLKNWRKYEYNPIVCVSANQWDCGFASDPCILKNGDEWVMYYYGYNYKKAEEGLAISKDLFNWTKYPKPIIRIGKEGDIDSVFAHKPSVISYNNVLYHFYCASRPYREGDPTLNFTNEFRTISVAVSKDIF